MENCAHDAYSVMVIAHMFVMKVGDDRVGMVADSLRGDRILCGGDAI